MKDRKKLEIHFTSTWMTLVYGYGNCAILIQSETFSWTPCPNHIRKVKITDSDIQSETTDSVAN